MGISEIAAKLEKTEPEVTGLRKAAVAVILSSKEKPAILFIKRAERVGDPWSGQVAFPGGKSQHTDGSAMSTAAREAMEEVGIELGKCSEFLGYFRAFRTHTGDMDVVPAVFLLTRDVRVRVNEEAVSYKWVKLDTLRSTGSRATYELRRGGETASVPALRVDDYVVWGLTHQIISTLVEEKRNSRS